MKTYFMSLQYACVSICLTSVIVMGCQGKPGANGTFGQANVAGIQAEGPSGGGGGGERQATREEVFEALNYAFVAGDMVHTFLGAAAPQIAREGEIDPNVYLPQNAQMAEAVKKVFIDMANTLVSLEADVTEETEVFIKPQEQCIHNGSDHLATNKKLNTKNSHGNDQWEVCFSILGLQRYSPATLTAVIVPLYFHEMAEIAGYSHEVANLVQESARIRLTYAELLNQVRIVREKVRQYEAVASEQRSSLRELILFASGRISGLSEGYLTSETGVEAYQTPLNLSHFSRQEKQELLSRSAHIPGVALDAGGSQLSPIDAFCGSERSGRFNTISDSSVTESLLAQISQLGLMAVFGQVAETADGMMSDRSARINPECVVVLMQTQSEILSLKTVAKALEAGVRQRIQQKENQVPTDIQSGVEPGHHH